MDKDRKYLNKILQGEIMGIQIYREYINKLPSSKEKDFLEEGLEEHLAHKNKIEYMLRLRGDKVVKELGLAGKMSEFFEKVRLTFRNKPKEIIKNLYRGEIIGLTYTHKYLAEFSQEVRPEIESLINEDSKRIEKIHDILRKM